MTEQVSWLSPAAEAGLEQDWPAEARSSFLKGSWVAANTQTTTTSLKRTFTRVCWEHPRWQRSRKGRLLFADLAVLFKSWNFPGMRDGARVFE